MNIRLLIVTATIAFTATPLLAMKQKYSGSKNDTEPQKRPRIDQQPAQKQQPIKDNDREPVELLKAIASFNANKDIKRTTRVLKKVLKERSLCDIIDNEGNTPLHWAVLMDSQTLVIILLSVANAQNYAWPLINQPNQEGKTALQLSSPDLIKSMLLYRPKQQVDLRHYPKAMTDTVYEEDQEQQDEIEHVAEEESNQEGQPDIKGDPETSTCTIQ